MEAFRPTWQQVLARGAYLGALVSVVGVAVALVVTGAMLAWADRAAPPGWLWAALTLGPPVVGALIGVPAGRRIRVEVSAGGLRTVSSPFGRPAVAAWRDVADLRVERRGARTVVAVYLESGASLRLQAPYSGELFAADPRFEGKMFALSSLWRSHRFGGLPG